MSRVALWPPAAVAATSTVPMTVMLLNSDAFMKRERYLSSSEEAADKQASLD